MPHKAVAQHFQLVLLAVADELVGHAEVEYALGRCQCLGLHAVLGHGTIKVFVHHRVSLRHLSVALPLINGRADEAVLAYGILQTLLGHRCQRHHGQTEGQYSYVFMHCFVPRFPC